MKPITVYDKDNFCNYSEYTINKQWIKIRENKDVCPICKQKFIEDEIIYLVINNYKLFPNIIVHKSCANSFCNLEETTRFLKNDCKKEKEIILCWR